MDIQELFSYKMSDDEKEKWETLKTDIINSIRAVNRYIYKNTINIDSYAKILQKILLEEDFRRAVKDRENHMRVSGVNWKYCFEQMEFYIDEEVEKQTEIQQKI